MIYDTCQKNLSVQSIMSFWLIQTSILQRLYTPKYKSSIPFFVFHFEEGKLDMKDQFKMNLTVLSKWSCNRQITCEQT